MGVTKLKLKFGGKDYRFHISYPTESLANREVKRLRATGFSAQHVTRKDYFYPHNTVYKVYKKKSEKRKKKK